ncbi:hypothetical protein [Pedobacter flavus]|uniref:Uncharacterized protein n=1 Tax=Pedobacter flavus TaxID=3113906 RepID=A0ABU7H0B2_9SPHI|nr:hypothetical protein [Pedobacter sp. VNH31]MEE1884724.1 hypothetical protein [Pedobacter sp. VNH31]
MLRFNSSAAFFLLSIIVLFNISCAKQVKLETEVYFNDFESGNSTGIQNLKVVDFFQTKVAGFYNNQELLVEINNLPKHAVAIIDFDLYIHDSWDGNSLEGDGIGGPDIWKFSVDDKNYINTTFSNTYCEPGRHCPPQSYPNDYPNNNNLPRAGVFSTMPGVCLEANNPSGTSLYKISKTIKHNSNKMLLSFKDLLVQKNTSNPLCDESWSIDNIRVRVIEL